MFISSKALKKLGLKLKFYPHIEGYTTYSPLSSKQTTTPKVGDWVEFDNNNKYSPSGFYHSLGNSSDACWLLLSFGSRVTKITPTGIEIPASEVKKYNGVFRCYFKENEAIIWNNYYPNMDNRTSKKNVEILSEEDSDGNFTVRIIDMRKTYSSSIWGSNKPNKR
jgi:hypothetical protein